MVPVALRVAAAFALTSAFVAVPVGAQTLATLHLRSFTMSAFPATLRAGEMFHLTIAAHVDERVLELDNVTLPDLAGFDVLGDERRCSASPRGSDCTETLSVTPTVAGDRTIAATIMDAVDGRTGKPSRFATNTVALHVASAPPQLPAWVGEAFWGTLLAALPLVSAALVLYALFRQLRRRRPFVRPQPLAPTPTPAPTPEDRDVRLRAFIAALAAEPTRERALAVRAELRERVAARSDETLADIAQRYRNGAMAQVLVALVAVERAAFCEPGDVARAVQEALPSLHF